MIEIAAIDVKAFDITPNLLGSIWHKIAGPLYLETTNSCATLERAGLRDIGRSKCLQISVTGFNFMTGTISAVFHGLGSCCS